MVKVLLGAPTTRDLPIPYVKSLWMTQLKGTLAWEAVFGQAVDVGRNNLVKRFLEKYQYDYLLMHDTDATWDGTAVQRLVDRQLPIVTGIIFKRSIPTVPTVGKFVNISPEGNYMYTFRDTINEILDVVEYEKIDHKTKNELVLAERPGQVKEIDAAGAHFMLIHRDVFTAIGDNWYECTRLNAGEDFAFCRKAQQAGFKLHADFSVFTGHHLGGMMELGLREFMLYRDHEKVETEWIA